MVLHVYVKHQTCSSKGNYRLTENTTQSAKVSSMLAYRPRRWPNIEPTLSECLVFAGLVYDGTEEGLASAQTSQQTKDIEQMLGQNWPAVYDFVPTLSQLWFDVLCPGIEHTP